MPSTSRSGSLRGGALWDEWLVREKGKPFPYQKQTWRAIASGNHGLVTAPTGFGKTYAVWGGEIRRWLDENKDPARWPRVPEPPRVLWITPLRALAGDSWRSLLRPVEELRIPWTVETRTGDTSAALRRKQKIRLPTALITTPESLSLLLSYDDSRSKLDGLRLIIVDEWHQLLGTKRGVQTELCLARLRAWFPAARVWGMSATFGNPQVALHALTAGAENSSLIAAKEKKQFLLCTLLPESTARFPLAGHSGLLQTDAVVSRIAEKNVTLLFTNTRSQAEMWFQAVLAKRPDWAGALGLHHGSLDRAERETVEAGLAAGTLRCVVCTASLDLGVDFSPVEQVIQIGGPKGIARMLQRAGRAGHNPEGIAEFTGVPAHAMEFVEYAAARDAVAAGVLENQFLLAKPFDVLAQHLVTIALGGGFRPEEMFDEIRTTGAYRDLTETEWAWVLEFTSQGGKSLGAYPKFHRITKEDGVWRVTDPHIARHHRMAVGTITSDSSVLVKLANGKYLGTVEESFVSRMNPGDGFTFAGKPLVLVRLREMTAVVRISNKPVRRLTRWAGSRMPLSSELARAVRARLTRARDGDFAGAEMRAARPALALQGGWSVIPGTGEFLIESLRTREGHHHFLFPFAGRLANEGLAALVAHRIGTLRPASFTFSVNDYGFSLSSPRPHPLDESTWRAVLSTENLADDILACLNTNELARRHFREIARVAGLVFQGYPGARKKERHVQASSGLFYDVFTRYDPENLLLRQARREVIEQQLEFTRLHETLREIARGSLVLVNPPRLTPLSFPLWAGFIHGRSTSESEGDRVRRMAEELERAAQE